MNPEAPQNTTSPVSAPQPATQQPITSQPSGSKGLAITAFVLSIVGFFTGFILIGYALATVALILSIIGLAKRKPGKGFNIASLIISGVCLLSAPFLIIGWIAQYNGVTDYSNQQLLEAQEQDLDY